jgi:hypothetical protein
MLVASGLCLPAVDGDMAGIPPLLRAIKTVHFDDYYTYEWPAAVEPWDRKPWIHAMTG